VLVIQLLIEKTGEVFDARPRPQSSEDRLVHRRRHLIVGARRDGGSVAGVAGFLLTEAVEAEVARRLRRSDVAVLEARALTGSGEPGGEERGVLAAPDCPEEGVAQRLTAGRRRAVGRQQKPGGAAALLNRIVDGR